MRLRPETTDLPSDSPKLASVADHLTRSRANAQVIGVTIDRKACRRLIERVSGRQHSHYGSRLERLQPSSNQTPMNDRFHY